MLITSSTGSSFYAGTTEKPANRNAEMFVLTENQQREHADKGQSETAASGDTSFSSKLASMFLVPERPEAEAGAENLAEDSLSIYEKQFLELADKTLAERIRDQYLEDHDLTEADVNAMSAEDREALEKDIAEAILEAMGVNEKTYTIALEINPPALPEITASDAENDMTP